MSGLPAQHTMDFDGRTYVPELDQSRLSKQVYRIYDATADGLWHTLTELAETIGASEPSTSARLRDLRKPRFGGHTILRKRTAEGLFHYRRVLS